MSKGINHERRVLVIGLDGATLDLIVPWAARGELPTFSWLMGEGAHGHLKSTMPALTPPAWTSSLTGKNPGKHNIFDFFVHERGSYKRRIVSARDRKSKAVWNILSECGKKVGVFNVPITYPPEEVKGFMVTGMLTPYVANNFTYPFELKDELLKMVGYRIEKNLGDLLKGNEVDFLKNITETTENKNKALLYLLKKFEWDLFVGVFDALDSLQHFFWKYIDEQHPQYKELSTLPLRDAILNHYKQLDRLIAEILGTIEKEGSVIIYSDHGFGPLYKDVFLNNWLEEKGFLKLRWNVQGLRLRLYKKNTILPTKIKNRLVKDHFKYSKLISAINWKATKSYFFSLSGQAIRLNVKAREPGGMIAAGEEYENVRDLLVQELQELKDPETGEALVEKVFKREEIYSGDFVENAPDLLLSMKEGYTLQEGFGKDLIMPATQRHAIRSGTHRANGILFMKGKGIRKGVFIESAEVVDIAPTLLYMMGLPVPHDMDGKVLKETFETKYLDENPIQYCRETAYREKANVGFSQAETEEVEKRLRGLGYMG